MADQELNILIRAKDDASKAFTKANKNFKELEKNGKAVSSSLRDTFGKLGTAIAALGVGVFVQDSLQQFTQFEQASEQMAKRFGKDVDVWRDRLSAAADGTINDFNIISFISKQVFCLIRVFKSRFLIASGDNDCTVTLNQGRI